MKMMRKVAEDEGKEGIKFKVMEVGSRTMKRDLQRSNPTATKGCPENDCVACKEERGKGGECRRNNVNYEIEQTMPRREETRVHWRNGQESVAYTKEHMAGKNREESE